MSALEVVWEVARAVYSLGLLTLGVVVLWGSPTALRVLRDLSAALSATATGLRAMTADREVVEQLRSAVARVEDAQVADRKTLTEIKTLAERLLEDRKQ